MMLLRGLKAPILNLSLACLCIVMLASGADAAQATVEVALFPVATQANFQQFTLNVVAVRLNPSTDPTIPESNKKWQTIKVPAPNGKIASGTGTIIIGSGPGTSQPNTKNTPILPGQISFDRLHSMAQLFAAGKINTQTYGQVELVLDSNNPGTVTPTCSSSPTGPEGCVAYPIMIASSSQTQTLRAAPISFTVNKKAITLLVINVNLGTITPGASAPPTAPYTINPTISVEPNNADGSNPELAVITGKIQKINNKKGATISAELEGSGQLVASERTFSDGTFFLGLPAATTGTSYDLYTNAGNRDIAVISNQLLAAGQSTTLNPNPPTHSASVFKGIVTDICSGQPIQGATLQLLASAASQTTDCGVVPTPAGCVVVASASTNESGKFPLPGLPRALNPFGMVPSNTTFGLKVTAPGYDPLSAKLTFGKSKFQCAIEGPTGTTFSTKTDPCNLSLARAEFQGSVSLSAPNTGAPLSVLIMAEDHNSNIIENVGMAMIPAGGTSARFDMFAPTASYLRSANPANTNGEIDLFAAAGDLFGGVPDPFTGHGIVVQSGIASTDAPAAGAACPAAVQVPNSLGPLECAGHGSLTGTVAAPFSTNTSVILSENGVGLMTASVSPAGEFSLCAPAGAYTLTRSDTAVATPVTLNAPITINAPCTSICQPSTPSTCFLCQATTLPGPLQ